MMVNLDYIIPVKENSKTKSCHFIDAILITFKHVQHLLNHS